MTTKAQTNGKKLKHPIDKYIRKDSYPNIWCPGCGIGIALQAFIKGVNIAEIEWNKVVVVSGIGCTGRVHMYLNTDCYHTTHGRPIPFAIGLKLMRPDLKVVVFSGDGDLFAIGGNHFIHAARRNMPIHVIAINNFNYGMTGGQGGPTTPTKAKSTTTPLGNYEHPFNIPSLAASCGATYVSRWTTMDIRRLKFSIAESLQKDGFTCVEVISPCPVSYGKTNQIGDVCDEMTYYMEAEELKPPNWFTYEASNPDDISLGLKTKIPVGKFVDIDKKNFFDMYQEIYSDHHTKGRASLPMKTMESEG